MNWSKINPYKTSIITGTLLFALSVVGFTLGYRSNSPNIADASPAPLFTQQTEEVDLKIKGNKNSKIYHLKGCPNYNDIATRNVVWFKTTEEAESAGFRMAKNC